MFSKSSGKLNSESVYLSTRQDRMEMEKEIKQDLFNKEYRISTQHTAASISIFLNRPT